MLTLILYNLPPIARASEVSVQSIERLSPRTKAKEEGKNGKIYWKIPLQKSMKKKDFFLLSSSSPFAFFLCSLLLLLARVFSDDVKWKKEFMKRENAKGLDDDFQGLGMP